MNVKRLFGVILTILGIAGLIYAAMLFMNRGGGSYKALAVYGILGAVFFFLPALALSKPPRMMPGRL